MTSNSSGRVKSAEEVVSDQFSDRDTIDSVPARRSSRSSATSTTADVAARQDPQRERRGGRGRHHPGDQRVPRAVRVGDDEVRHLPRHSGPRGVHRDALARGELTDVVVLVVAADDGVIPRPSVNKPRQGRGRAIVVAASTRSTSPGDVEQHQIFGQLAEHGLNPPVGRRDRVIHAPPPRATASRTCRVLDYRPSSTSRPTSRARRGAPSSSRAWKRSRRREHARQNGELSVGDFIVAGRRSAACATSTTAATRQVGAALVRDPDLRPRRTARRGRQVLRRGLAQTAQRRSGCAQRERTRRAQGDARLDPRAAQDGERGTARRHQADVRGSVDVLRESVQSVSGERQGPRCTPPSAASTTRTSSSPRRPARVIVGFNVIPPKAPPRRGQGVRIRPTRSSTTSTTSGHGRGPARTGTPGGPRPRRVRKVFKLPRSGAIAGCYVTGGVIERNAFIRVTRGDIVIENDRVSEPQAVQDDAKEVRMGQVRHEIVGYDDSRRAVSSNATRRSRSGAA